jgi:hypothetical protein
MNVTGETILGTVTMGWLDMGVFVMMLGMSAVIGCYFGFCSGRKNSASEYLMGGKSMGILPISLSLISRQVFHYTHVDIFLLNFLHATFGKKIATKKNTFG